MPPLALPQNETRQDEEAAKPARVILYNDDWHTFDEVIRQMVKATGCSAERGEEVAWTVHTQGRALAFEGPRGECEKVAGVLREIRLHVEVDWDD